MDELRAILSAGLPVEDGPGRYPSALGFILHDGTVLANEAVGEAVRYADRDHTLLPPEKRIPARFDTIYDIASITKMFTGVIVLQLVEAGVLDLDEPVASWLPSYRDGVKRRITLRMLLTHVAGFLPGPPVWKQARYSGQRRRMLLEAEPVREPGTGFQYSDIGYQTAAFLAEQETGTRWEDLVEQRILEPLGMLATGFNPSVTLLPRIAAAEERDDLTTGIVHGRVHDENAYALSGVAGHAGLFSTAYDLARFGEILQCDGTVKGLTLLEPESVKLMRTDLLPPDLAHPHGQGIGARVNDPKFMGALAPTSFGHTGFTGTSIVIDPAHKLTVVLLTNRVHPTRATEVNPVRRAVADLALRMVS